MDRSTLVGRGLVHHWRTNLAVAAGVAVASAVLTGALLVGDSMRESLRDAALERLGRVDHALITHRFFREALAGELAAGSDSVTVKIAVPIIVQPGGIVHADKHSRVEHVSILGVDQRFNELSGEQGPTFPPVPTGRVVVINDRVAEELGADIGDDVLLRVGRPQTVSPETLLGRRDRTTVGVRLTVQAIVAAEGLGAFSVDPQQGVPRNVYVPLTTLQRVLDRHNQVNALLVSVETDRRVAGGSDADELNQALRRCVTLDDLGLRIRVDHEFGYAALESTSFLLAPPVEHAGVIAAESAGGSVSRVFTHLANSITLADGASGPETPAPAIPYSTVTAWEPPAGVSLATLDGSVVPTLSSGDVLLNEWAAEDLAAKPGEQIKLTYYVTGPFGHLDTRTSTFVLRGIVPMVGPHADPGFTPSYPGITDSSSIADWDPPFPVDLKRIRERDEKYWERFRATPKAFISLGDGERLWADQPERFGQLTSLRIYPPDGAPFEATVADFERALREKLNPAELGLRFDPVRTLAIESSKGSTDFAGLFVGFSWFLIVSAAMLVALLFRLGVERRAEEVGTMLATGFTRRQVTYQLLAEGAVLADIGAVVGLVGSAGYAWLMLAGLRTWWSAAAHAPFLRLHFSAGSLVIGYVASVAVCLVAIVWAVRGLTSQPPRALLAGAVAAAPQTTLPHRHRRATVVAVGACTFGILLVAVSALTGMVPDTIGFFGGGALLLVGGLSWFARWLWSPHRPAVARAGGAALLRLGAGNAPRHPSRSLLTAGLIASATFLIVSLEAFRLRSDVEEDNPRQSGTGGYRLVAESSVPLSSDLATTDGRKTLNLAPDTTQALAAASVAAFRLRPGDETSCLNLYLPTRPRIVGAGDAFVDRGGFGFASTLAQTDEERRNPWLLLRRRFTDGAVPAIGDESAVKWQLHLGLGDVLTITDDRGRDVRLRIVGLLAGSILQGELVVHEQPFTQLFPGINGYRFFLIDTPAAVAADISAGLERDLSNFGFDVTSAADRLADYFAVQNTYLSTFQTLGGLGLVLGTIGLGAVLLRNVWERRSELALLRAVGFSRAAINWVVLAENLALVAIGLVAGILPALVVISPHLAGRFSTIPWGQVAMVLAAVPIVGFVAGVAALRAAMRGPILAALRSE